MDYHDFECLNTKAPIYRQLYWRFREAIAEQRLQAGERVPSVRSLASELNLSRGTVEQAYQLLTSEGYLLAQGPAGTVVSPQLAHYAKVIIPSLGINTQEQQPTLPSKPKPFQLGLPALDAFPSKTWTRLAGQSLRSLDAYAMGYPPVNGHPLLRKAITTYLGISRGIACTPEQVFITTGYQASLNLICHTLLQADDQCWIENPSYHHAWRFLKHTGLELVPTPVDKEGLCVEVGKKLAPQAKVALVTPTHQSPIGVGLSLPRKHALLDWANTHNAWIIEDDYDSEYRYYGHPLPPLKSLDREGRVLYAGTFSKVIFPGLRLAYLVVPEKEVEHFQHKAEILNYSSSILMQITTAEFINQGHFARHLKKMRSLYALRRDYLVNTLQQVFGKRLHIELQAGGIHVLAYLNAKEDDKALALLANADGLAVQALSNWSLTEESLSGLLFGFTNITSAEEALSSVQRLHNAFL